MGEKFLSIVEQDTDQEKFANGDLSEAVFYDDYISTSAAEGQMTPPDLFEKGDPHLLSSGSIEEVDNIYFQPELALMTGLGGYAFLAQSLGEVQTTNPIASMAAGEKMYISVNSDENKAFTIYAGGFYTNAVIYDLLCQLNEMNLALEAGPVNVETNWFASRQLLDETNLERGLSNWDGKKLKYGNLNSVSIADFTISDGILTVPVMQPGGATNWTNVGCEIQSGAFNMNFDLQEETGFGFCNDGWSDGFKNGALEITGELEVTQESDIWMKMTNGGTLEFTELGRKSVCFQMEDVDFIMDLILPYGVIGLDGANVPVDNPTETITFSNEGANVSYDGKTFRNCEALIVLTKKPVTEAEP